MHIIISFVLLLLFLQFPDNIPSSRRSRAVIDKQKPLITKQLSNSSLTLGSQVFIRIFKKENCLELWIKDDTEFELFKTYEICYYSGTLGPKLREGDCQSPEGFYHTTSKGLNPNSRFHLSFDTGYPNEYDRYHRRTGGSIYIHGNCVSIGCFAMTDPVIEEIYTVIYSALKNGQKKIHIHIFPFRMTEDNMEKYKDSEWAAFWKNLKEGYDYFDQNRKLPKVIVRQGEYWIDD